MGEMIRQKIDMKENGISENIANTSLVLRTALQKTYIHFFFFFFSLKEEVFEIRQCNYFGHVSVELPFLRG